MVNRNAIRVLAGAAIGAVILGGCSGQVDKSGGEAAREPLVLTGINTRSAEEVQPFVDEVTMLSEGALEVAFESGWHHDSATGEAEAIDAVRAGSTDFAVVPVRAWRDAGVRSFDALIAPMVVDSYALQDAVLQGGMVKEMLTGVDELGLTGIGILPGPMRKPAGIDRDLLTPNDYADAQIGISKGAVADRSLRELGATPVASPFEGEDVSQFDGLESQVEAIAGNEYDGVVTSVTMNVNLWPRPYVIVGNTKAVEALSDAQLGLLTDAAQQAVPATSRVQEQTETDSIDLLCRRANLAFVAAAEDQLHQLQDALKPVNDWLAEDEQTRGFLQRIQELRGTVTPVSASLPDCAGTSPGAATDEVSALDGRWNVSYTVEEYVAAGADPGEAANPENIGEFYLEFGAGRFTLDQVGGPGDGGSYTLDGDVVTLDRNNGELFMFGWSVYRDALTFVRVPGAVSPTGFIVEPWTRVGG